MLSEISLIKNVFSTEELNHIKSLVSDPKSFEFQEGFSRYIIGNGSLKELDDYANKLVPVAREIFQSKELIPTYSLFSHYEGSSPAPSLYKHKDDNACTYTIDLCLYQTEPWDLWVENVPYCLNENEALCYYGNDQLHWREDFPNPGVQKVAMIFFHFAEPDHWFFKEGPGYLNVIRNNITQEEWDALKING
jgi:hypothetical protein